MAGEERRFLNYENSWNVYKSKTALIIGTIYFSKGYQSTPVIGMQFASAVDPNAQQKTFDWDTDEKVWYFPNYDSIFELATKLNKWKTVIALLKKEGVTDGEHIKDKYGKIADVWKINNPQKKKNIYMIPRYYNGYYLGITLNGKITVSLTEDELNCMAQFVGDFIKDYHNLSLLHRLMNYTVRNSAGSNGSSSQSSKSNAYQQSNYNTTQQKSVVDEGQVPDLDTDVSFDDVMGDIDTSGIDL